MYQPILTVLPVLCASRLANLHFGRSRSTPSTTPPAVRTLISQSAPTLTEKNARPQPFALRTSISPPDEASIRSGVRSAHPTTRSGKTRALMHQMSANSLRQHLQVSRNKRRSEMSEGQSALKTQISYPVTFDASQPTSMGMDAASLLMSRSYSEGPSSSLVANRESSRSTGLPSVWSHDMSAWTPRSANLGLAPQPASRRKLPSLTSSDRSQSDRSSGEVLDNLQMPRKPPFSLLTPPIEQQASRRFSSMAAEQHRSSSGLGLPSPSNTSEKPSNSWPASTDNEDRDNMSTTRRSSDIERKPGESLASLQQTTYSSPTKAAEQVREHDSPKRPSYAESALDNPRDRSIDLGSVVDEQTRFDPPTQDDRSSTRSRTREPSLRSLAVSLEDADEDELRQIIDARGFAKPKAERGLSREERFQRALSLRAAGNVLNDAKKAAASSRRPQDSDALAGSTDESNAAAVAAATEASSGLAEISHNPRLKRLESMGKEPRTNPFAAVPKLGEEGRKPSDQSTDSGPSQVTEVTNSSGSGSAGSRATDGSRFARRPASRVGVGERGGVPPPIQHVKSAKNLQMKAGKNKGKGSAKSKTSGKESSDGGRSGDSNGTFGFASVEP